MQNRPPVGIIVVCAVLGVLTFMALIGLRVGFTNPLIFIYLLASIVLDALVIYGLWNMKKWSVILYVVSVLVGTVISLVQGGLSIMIVIPVILLAVMYMNYGLME